MPGRKQRRPGQEAGRPQQGVGRLGQGWGAPGQKDQGGGAGSFPGGGGPGVSQGRVLGGLEQAPPLFPLSEMDLGLVLGLGSTAGHTITQNNPETTEWGLAKRLPQSGCTRQAVH